MNKKGQIMEQLGSMVPALVGVAIVLVVGFLIMAQVKEQALGIETTCPAGAVFVENGTDLCCNATFTQCGGGNTSQPRHSLAYNGSGEVQDAIGDIPGWLPIIVITIIGALLLGLVAMFRSR